MRDENNMFFFSAIDGVRPVKDIFNEAAPSPYHPEWEPIFVVFSTKTGQLSHFLTEQVNDGFIFIYLGNAIAYKNMISVCINKSHDKSMIVLFILVCT